MHAIEKILANAAGKESVEAGDILNCNIDLAGINDIYLQTLKSFYEMGGAKVYDKEKIVVFFDHYAPASTIQQAENQKEFRKFCGEQKMDKLMDVNEGVCHQILVDKGLVYPGMTLIVTDSHTTTHGALGAFSTGVGATDLAIAMTTGKLWFRVPEVIKINLEGSLQKGVFAKDIILHIIGDLGADFAIYKAVEFAGTLVKNLSLSERMTICNMATEMGAKNTYIQPDEITFDYLKKNNIQDYKIYETDPDFTYSFIYNVDVSKIKSSVAIPFSVDNVVETERLKGIKIDQAYIGSCTNGRIDDIEIAAKILAGKSINKNTRLIIVPASSQILSEAAEKGYLQTLLQAGATFVTPGCAACLGIHEGILASDETCITSTNRNFPGRMGSSKAKIYIASPACVALSALKGEIVNPQDYDDFQEV